jgi:Ran GTPase-activating protein (RanGAP) involved in mRNA processing and transport
MDAVFLVLMKHRGHDERIVRSVCKDWKAAFDLWNAKLKLRIPTARVLSSEDLVRIKRLIAVTDDLHELEIDGGSNPADISNICDMLSKAIGGGAKSLRRLKITGMEFQTNFSTVRLLEGFTPLLQSLDLSYNRLDRDHESIAKALMEVPALQELRIHYSHLGPHGTTLLSPSLERLVSLRHLDLGRNRMGCSGAVAIARAMRRMAALEHLDLGENDIKASGIAALADALPRKKMRHVTLGGNDIDGESVVSLALALKDMVFLEELDLSNTRFDAKLLTSVLVGFPRLRQLDLSFNNILDVQAIAPLLKNSPMLQELDLSGNLIGILSDMQTLARSLQQLRKLHMDCNDICADGIAALAPSLKSLELLGLGCNRIGAKGAAELTHCLGKDLRHLDLSNNDIGDAGVAALLQWPGSSALQYLNLANNNLCDKTLASQFRSGQLSST